MSAVAQFFSAETQSCRLLVSLSFNMRTTTFVPRLLLIYCCFLKAFKAGVPLDGLVRSECRDRYLWIQVASAEEPSFEAVDEDGVHSISEELASRCGYTISTFKMDGFTTFRASFYSCFTHNQNDELFTFRFNVIVSEGARWSSQPISTVCSGLSWTHREITCEEDYMEIIVNRESSCGGERAEGKQAWQEALFQAQRMASLTWQLMFLQNDGQISFMSVPDAQKRGYSLTATAHRVVFRSPYKQPHAEVMMVDGVAVKVLQVSLFFKQKLVVVMIDMSMVCTVHSELFDDTQLLWNVPQVLPVLVGKGARFESQSFRLGLGDALLDKVAASPKGLEVVQQGGMVEIIVPVGTEGGYRKSLVEDNVYKEFYTALLMGEHVFSLIYEDDNSIDTKHRILKVLETPLISHPPFSLNQTTSDNQEFSVYLGNIPADVILENIWINGKQMLGKSEQNLSISPIVHLNGSQAFKLRLPFDNAAVHWMNLGGGVVQYSIDVNFTLTIMPQKESYFHQAFITTHVFNAFPPQITAQCLDEGISFTIASQSQSLWEVGIDNEPLTAELVAQRGYHLHNDSHKTTLEVPVFSVGYTYEDINLSNFYATFKINIRNSKTLEVQASASKRCLFRTGDMIVCSADGTMTVVATPASTWPSVQPERTSLLDRTCKPKQTNGARVLFEFKLNSCGTKTIVGDWYVVYENEILHDRLLIADGPNFISRDPQFKVTVRCFYPLSAVNRVSMDRAFSSATPGFGSVRVFESHRDSVNKHQHYPKLHPNPAAEEILPHLDIRPRSKPGPSPVITVPGGQEQLQFPTNQDWSLQYQISQDPQSYWLPSGGPQWVQLKAPNQNFEGEEWATSGPALKSFKRFPGDHLESQKLQSLASFTEDARNSDLPWGQSSFGQSNFNQQNPSLQRPLTDLSFGMTELSQPFLSFHGPSNGELELVHMERPVYQHQPQTHEVHPFQQPQDHISTELLQPDERTTLAPVGFKTNIPNWSKVLQESFHSEQGTGIRDVQNLGSPEPFERTESRVQNIRVKPPSTFISLVPHLNQKPVVHQTHSQNSNPSLYPTDLTADGNQRTPQQTELRGPTMGELYVMRPDVLTLAPKQVQENVQVEQVQKYVNLVEPRSRLVQSLAEKENSEQPASGVSQTSEISHIRIRPVGLQSTVQTPNQFPHSQNQQHLTKEGSTRTFHQTKDNIDDQNPITGEAKFTRLQPYPEGLEDSELLTQSRLSCGDEQGPDGASVYEGIFRGKQTI
ncbi:uncharacterized protein LOC106527668 isoform X2 [Austrofundulus limnaeus]|uniref:Uncharacterized protein LOC106527668 isoform X2 n=1 Tax=Austrofundulus limnaeus TaxID=52670 RepID=A0A2I4CDK5_AUSLI|nr:PREDICTED: uncharacterized protein LOC106527668 isoform X2 [Austrofundulus limnaeus]